MVHCSGGSPEGFFLTDKYGVGSYRLGEVVPVKIPEVERAVIVFEVKVLLECQECFRLRKLPCRTPGR